MADPDAAPVQRVLNVAPRRRVTDVHHYRQVDDLRAGFEVLERGTFGHRGRVGRFPSRLNPSSPDKTLTVFIILVVHRLGNFAALGGKTG